MPSSPKTVYLISGANRGIGFGFVSSLITRPNVVVFAGCRDPSKATALNALASQHSDKLHVLKLTSCDEADNVAALEVVEKIAGRLDVVIANAGIAKCFSPVFSTPTSEWRDHFDVNVVGPLVLFQSSLPLLRKSEGGQNVFSVISSNCGSVTDPLIMRMSAYGASKAAVNFVITQIHGEHAAEGVCAFVMHPGHIATEMAKNSAHLRQKGNAAAVANGMTEAPTSVEVSVAGMMQHLDGATVESKGGRFWSYGGKDLESPW